MKVGLVFVFRTVTIFSFLNGGAQLTAFLFQAAKASNLALKVRERSYLKAHPTFRSRQKLSTESRHFLELFCACPGEETSHHIFLNLPKTGKFPCTASIWRKNMLWPDDVTDEQLALAAAKCDEDEQTREGNENESFGFQISSCYFDIFDREL